MPGWLQSPAARAPPSTANAGHEAETSSSSGRCSSPLSPPWATPPHGPTTTANAPLANATTPPLSAWPVAGSTSSSRCCATEVPTNPTPGRPLDQTHRDTRPAAVGSGGLWEALGGVDGGTYQPDND